MDSWQQKCKNYAKLFYIIVSVKVVISKTVALPVKKCPVLKNNCTETDTLAVTSVDQFINLPFVAGDLPDEVVRRWKMQETAKAFMEKQPYFCTLRKWWCLFQQYEFNGRRAIIVVVRKKNVADTLISCIIYPCPYGIYSFRGNQFFGITYCEKTGRESFCMKKWISFRSNSADAKKVIEVGIGSLDVSFLKSFPYLG